MSDRVRRGYRDPFARTPEALLDDQRVTDKAVRVWSILDRYAGRDGIAFPGRKAIAARLGCSLDALDRAVRNLEASGWLEVERRDGRSSLYTLLHPDLERVEDDDEEAAEGSRIFAATPQDEGSRTDAATPPTEVAADSRPLGSRIFAAHNESQLEREVTPPPPADAVGVEEVEGEIVEEGDTPDPEHQRLAVLLADLVEANGALRPGTGKRAVDVIRLMVERDGRTLAQIEAAIRWSAQDEFWRSVVLSPRKLRQHYDAMALRARASGRRESAHEKAQRERRARIARLEVA